MSWLPFAELPQSNLLLDFAQLDTAYMRRPGDATLRSVPMFPFIEFSRTSRGTFINAQGQIELTPQSRNLYTYTSEFSNTVWVKTNMIVSPRKNAVGATLGAEQVANGGFVDTSSWSTPIAGASISGGALTFDGTTPISVNARITTNTPTTPIVPGRVYRVEYTIVSDLTRAVSLSVGGVSTSNRLSAGTYVDYVQALDESPPAINARSTTGARTGSIDNISVREVQGDFILAPNGNRTTDTLIAAAGTHSPQVRQVANIPSGVLHTASVRVRAGGWRFVQLAPNNQTTEFCNFDLTGAGAVQTNGNCVGGISFDPATGYYTISMVYTGTGASIVDRGPFLAMVPSLTATRLQTHTWDGTEFITVWGPQLEVTPESRVALGPELSSTAVPFTVFRDSSGSTASPTLAVVAANKLYSVGLNVTANSSTTFSNFSGASPAYSLPTSSLGQITHHIGVTTAGNLTLSGNAPGVNYTVDFVSVREMTVDPAPTAYTWNGGGLFPARLTYDAVTLQPRGLLLEPAKTNLLLNSLLNGTSLSTQSVTVTGVAHTLSFYGTGTVTLSGAHSATVTGTGAYPTRTEFTFTPSAGSLTLTVSGEVQFAQLETGDFATSFIPTAGSQATRSADNAIINGIDFFDWFNLAEGTFLVESSILRDPSVAGAANTIITAHDGTSLNRISFDYNNNATRYLKVGTGLNSVLLTASPTFNTVRLAGGYKVGSYAFCQNGGTVFTSAEATGQPSGINRLTLAAFSGAIRRIRFWPTRLTNAQLQLITGTYPSSVGEASASPALRMAGSASVLAIAAATAAVALPISAAALALPIIPATGTIGLRIGADGHASPVLVGAAGCEFEVAAAASGFQLTQIAPQVVFTVPREQTPLYPSPPLAWPSDSFSAPVKDPQARLLHAMSWADWLAPGEKIFSAVLTCNAPDDLLVELMREESSMVTWWVSGGRAGQNVTVTVRIETDAGQIDERSVLYRVRER